MTVEPLVPILRSAALVAGIDATVHVGQFNSYAQEILDPASALYSFDPNIVVLAVQTRDIAPEIWDGYADLSEADAQAAVDRVLRDFAGWVRAFRERSNASLVIHNLEKPARQPGSTGNAAQDGPACGDRSNQCGIAGHLRRTPRRLRARLRRSRRAAWARALAR